MEKLIVLNSIDFMLLKKIETLTRYQEIVSRYGIKGCLTNDYIQRKAATLILHDSLYEYCEDNNAFLLVKKSGFWRVYYYINDLSKNIVIDREILTSEIIYRDMLREPIEQIEYLESCGFKPHLVRDQYSAMYKDLHITIPNDEIIIKLPQTKSDVHRAFELFNLSFDKFTGDYVPSELYDELFETSSVLLAWKKSGNEDVLLGALHQTVENGIAWVSHIAVRESARGKHVGQALLYAFVERNKVNENSRYMLWVQRRNEVAVNMYSQIGFKQNRKSSVSNYLVIMN